MTPLNFKMGFLETRTTDAFTFSILTCKSRSGNSSSEANFLIHILQKCIRISGRMVALFSVRALAKTDPHVLILIKIKYISL